MVRGKGVSSQVLVTSLTAWLDASQVCRLRETAVSYDTLNFSVVFVVFGGKSQSAKQQLGTVWIFSTAIRRKEKEKWPS